MEEPPSPRQQPIASRSFSKLSDVTLTSTGSHGLEDCTGNAPPDALEALDVAAALERVGGFGPGQWCVVAVMGFVWVLMAASFSVPIFVAAAAEREVVRCPLTAAAGEAAESTCQVGSKLADDEWCGDAYRDAWRYTRKAELLTAEWDLICSDRLLASSVGSAFFFGVLGGNAVFSPVPDKIGRCRTFAIAGLLGVVGAAICAEAKSFSMYLAGRLWAGFGFGGLGNASWISATEVVGKEYTSAVMLAMNSMWACGIMLLAPLALALPAWRALSKLLAMGQVAICAVGLLAWYRGLESPQWLAAHGYVDRFHMVMGWLGRMNGREHASPLPRAPLPESGASLPESSASTEASSPKPKGNPGRCTDMVCRQPTACWTGLFVLAFCGCSLGYYGLSLNAGNLGGSVHVSTFLTGIVEIPALLAAKKLADIPRIGRRGTVMGGLGLSGLFCLLSAVLPPKSASASAAAILGKLCVSTAFCTVIMQAGEAYPTTVRGAALGLFTTCSRVAGVLAPVVVMLPAPLPFLAIGTWLTMSCLPLMGLPETLGRPAPSSLAEICARAPAKHAGFGCCGRRYHELEEDAGGFQGGQAPGGARQRVEMTVIGRPAASQL